MYDFFHDLWFMGFPNIILHKGLNANGAFIVVNFGKLEFVFSSSV